VGSTYQFNKISGGTNAACARYTSSGALFCWGADNNGLTSPPTGAITSFSLTNTSGFGMAGTARPLTYWGLGVTHQNVAGLEPNGINFVQVAGGTSLACGLSDSALSRAYCWAFEGDVQAMLSSDVPQARLITIAVGRTHACGIDESGSPLCWGMPASGGAQTVPNDL
jgi:hypothetical protein